MISSFLLIKVIISCIWKSFTLNTCQNVQSTIQICRSYHNTNSSLDRKRIDPIQKLLFEKKYSLYILHQTCFSILSNVSSTTSYLLVVVKKISEVFFFFRASWNANLPLWQTWSCSLKIQSLSSLAGFRDHEGMTFIDVQIYFPFYLR